MASSCCTASEFPARRAASMAKAQPRRSLSGPSVSWPTPMYAYNRFGMELGQFQTQITAPGMRQHEDLFLAQFLANPVGHLFRISHHALPGSWWGQPWPGH